MLEVLILWGYMLLVCMTAGAVVLSLLSRILSTPKPSFLGPASCVMTGIFALTIYAEYFSLFCRCRSRSAPVDAGAAGSRLLFL